MCKFLWFSVIYLSINLPGHKQFGYLVAECLGHFLAADIGDTLEREIYVNRIARAKIVLNTLDNELDEIAVCIN